MNCGGGIGPSGGGGLSPVRVVKVHVVVSIDVAQPLNDERVESVERSFSFHHWAPQNMTWSPTLTCRSLSPIAKPLVVSAPAAGTRAAANAAAVPRTANASSTRRFTLLIA